MSLVGVEPSRTRLPTSGDEAGTAPEDRRFRPDVQGLRAVAILAVVLYHASVPGFAGGYVGVDVFFVISGFVITGVLLRERTATARTSILAFYARRARRIIPAATVVIVVTVVVGYHWLAGAGLAQSTHGTGYDNAVDGLWASIFLVNFHFTATSTQYLAATRAPSLLQNFWSLAVEEQFYLVYPALFLVVAGVTSRLSLRRRVGILLGVAVVASFAWSVAQTSSNPSAAYFSPFTRAWELALGGLVAVSTGVLRKLPPAAAALLTWVGAAGVAVGVLAYGQSTAYPGSAVAVPVVGAALVIAGGAAQPTWGAEAVLRLRPLQWLGLISYSLYLWHWPVLQFAAQVRGRTSLPVADNLCLVVLALALAVATYHLCENPIRHARELVARPGVSVALGGCLVVASVGVVGVDLAVHPHIADPFATARPAHPCQAPSGREVEALAATDMAQRGSLAQEADGGRLAVTVVGDSTACTLLPGLEAVGSFAGATFRDGAVIGCGVVSGQLAPVLFYGFNADYDSKFCAASVARVDAAVLAHSRPDVVLWASTWEGNALLVGGRTLVVGSPGWKAELLARMDARLRTYSAHGARLVMVLEPPPAAAHPGNPPTADDRNAAAWAALQREFAAQHPGQVSVIDLAALVCPGGPPCPAVVSGVWARPDDYHYSPSSSVWVAKWLVPQLLGS